MPMIEDKRTQALTYSLNSKKPKNTHSAEDLAEVVSSPYL